MSLYNFPWGPGLADAIQQPLLSSASSFSSPSPKLEDNHDAHHKLWTPPYLPGRQTREASKQNLIRPRQASPVRPSSQRRSKRRTKSEPLFVSTAPEDVLKTPSGRARKALKGLKVHSCHCGKVYTRAEHLRRHQLSHEEPFLTCIHYGCLKSFSRGDLLERHMKAHDNPVTTNTPVAATNAPSDFTNIQTRPYLNPLDFLATTATISPLLDMPECYQIVSAPPSAFSCYDQLDLQTPSSTTAYPWYRTALHLDTPCDSAAMSTDLNDASSTYSFPPQAAQSHSSFDTREPSVLSTPALSTLDVSWPGPELMNMLAINPEKQGLTMDFGGTTSMTL